MKRWTAGWLALLGLAQGVRAAPAWPAPPRVTTSPSPTTAGANQDIDQNLTLIKGNNAPEARKLGATKLLEIGGADAANKLAGILQNKSPDLAAQIAVCSAIADFDHPDPSLLDPLLNLLGDSRSGLSDVLVQALHRFDRKQLVGRLRPIALNELATTKKRQERLAAITALGDSGDEKDAVAALAELLNDPSRTIQATALAAFSQATGVAHQDVVAARTWWIAHKEMGAEDWLRAVNEARIGQVRSVRSEKAELTKRLIVAYRDAYLHTPEAGRTKFLQSLLTDALPAVRSLGLDLINDLITDRMDVPQELRPLIVGTLVDPDPKVRVLAARMVSDLRMTVAMAKLTDAVSREIVDEVRTAQIAALGRLDDAKAVPTLIDRLSDESPMVVGETALALGNLARRGRVDDETKQTVVRVLLERFENLKESNDELREKFLMAMAPIDAPELKQVFERELRQSRAVTLRRIAIVGLATGGDPSVAEIVRPLLSSTEPEIRLAVVDALGKCGRTKDDRDALISHLGPEREPDAAVRQRAWDAFLLALQHSSPNERLSIAESFNLPDDKTAQRRRLDILKGIKADTTAYDALPLERRIELLEQTAEVQFLLVEYAAAAASLEQAIGLLKDTQSPRYVAMASRCVAASLKGRDDDHALQRIEELTDGESINGELADAGSLADVLREEIRSRIETADDALDLEQALRLTALSAEFAQKIGPSFVQDITALRTAATAKRDAVIDRLLASLAGDPDAENTLVKYHPQAVLSRILQQLSSTPATSAPADQEDRLVRLARRLAPQWPGYTADTRPEQKTASLDELRKIAAPSMPEDHPAPAIESTTSAPDENKFGLHTAENSDEP